MRIIKTPIERSSLGHLKISISILFEISRPDDPVGRGCLQFGAYQIKYLKFNQSFNQFIISVHNLNKIGSFG